MIDRRLNVMFVASTLEVGGVERLLIEVLDHLDLTRFRPMVVCLKAPGPLAEELSGTPVPVFADLTAHRMDLRVLYRLTRLMRRQRVDAVFTLNPGDKMFWGRLCAHLARVPVAVSAVHSTGAVLPDGRMASVLGWPNKRLTVFTDYFIALCDYQKQYLIQSEGLPARKVTVVYNGVSADKVRPRRPAAEVRQELGLPGQAPVVGIVAVMRPEKRHDIFLRAAAAVLRSHPETHFLVVGDGPMRARIESLWRALGLQQRVHLLGFRSDVVDVMNVMDVVALTSHPADTFPLSLLEAMALGKPLVVTDVPGGIKELVAPAGNESREAAGLIVPPLDPRIVARAVNRLIEDPDLARDLGTAGQKRVRERFTIERTVAQIQDLIAGAYEHKMRLRGLGRGR
ncbi:MAG: glycosyltransferase [Proteobacteria bacterium]|nr:glycosyltransferase [Pseudomonadota bacterium]